MAIAPYLGLITSEHKTKPKFTAWLSAALTLIDDGMQMTSGMPTDFAIDNAVGVQLDTLGQMVGVSRDIGIPLSDGTSVLDDTHYRILLQARIAQNNWDGTTEQIYSLWQTAFPGSELQIIDNQNMTIQAAVTGLTDQTSLDMVTAGLIIPKPMGVGVSIISTSQLTMTPYVAGVVSSDGVQQLTIQT